MRKADKHLIGIGFWTGGTIFSMINIFKILTHANILSYDYIMTGVAFIFIIVSLIFLRKKNKGYNRGKKDNYTFGISFWIGGGIYSLINIIMNLRNTPQSNILSYNYLITGVAVIGLILNIILLIEGKKNEGKVK
jgi:amino acid transporter